MKINFLTLLIFLFFLTSFSGKNEKDTTYRPKKDYALFFAVSDYSEWQDLRNPISDARKIAKELRDNYGFGTKIVNNPTLDKIVTTLQEYSNYSYANDGELFIFFSGHGEFTQTQEGFFIPSDGKLSDNIQRTYLPHARLERIVNSIPCNHILLALDACYSGTFDDEIALLKGDDRPNANNRSSFIKRKLKYKSRLYLTSGGNERTPDPSQFAKNFLIALRDFGGGDGVLTFVELAAYLEKANPQPRNGEFGNNEPGGDFLFVLEGFKEGKPSRQNTTPNISKSRTASDFSGSSGYFTDSRDGQRYPWSRMKDGRIWMTKNLNYKTSKSYCYDSNESNCNEYGRLYKWSVAMKACPWGWHLPTNEEWETLFEDYGRKGTSSYESLIGGGNNKFHYLTSGVRQSNGEFRRIRENGYYWSATEYGTGSAWDYYFVKANGKVYRNYGSKTDALSCRCIKD